MELRDYLRILRAHWLGVVLLFVLGVAVSGVWSLAQPKVYTAETSGYVAAKGASDLGSSMIGNQLATAKVKSYLDMGSWRTVAEYAIAELHLQVQPEDLVDQVTVTNPTNTVILQVSASASSPEGARDLAEAWLRGMIQQVEKIESADGKTPAVTVVAGDSARLPKTPSSPNWKLNLALGALAGLLIGIGYAVVRDRMDQRIRSASDVERATGLPVVGALALEPSLAKNPRLLPLDGSRDRDLAVLAESFRALRTNLQYMSIDDPPRAIVVTSSVPGDGKSFTAANLAIALAAAGERVVLIDGDLRRPRIADMFGLPGEAGLSDALAGRAHVRDLVQPVGPQGNLEVLAAGPIPPNPSEILGSAKMRDLLDQLTANALVIIDAPPLLPVTDAAVLSTRADGALVVVRTGSTTYEMLEIALGNLEKAKGKVLGVVLNRVPTSGTGKAYYGYQYTGDYYQGRNHADGEVADAPPAAAEKPQRALT